MRHLRLPAVVLGTLLAVYLLAPRLERWTAPQPAVAVAPTPHDADGRAIPLWSEAESGRIIAWIGTSLFALWLVGPYAVQLACELIARAALPRGRREELDMADAIEAVAPFGEIVEAWLAGISRAARADVAAGRMDGDVGDMIVVVAGSDRMTRAYYAGVVAAYQAEYPTAAALLGAGRVAWWRRAAATSSMPALPAQTVNLAAARVAAAIAIHRGVMHRRLVDEVEAAVLRSRPSTAARPAKGHA